MAITKELFGTLPNGQDITAYLLDNGNGVSARILNYGGIVRNLYVEDKNTAVQAATSSLTLQKIM